MFFTKKDQEIIHLSSKVAELEAINKILDQSLQRALKREEEIDNDNRELRSRLLARVGLGSVGAETGKPGTSDLRPIRKTTIPWNVQAAKLEADSKERYWKKIIAERETQPTSQEHEDFERDMNELNK